MSSSSDNESYDSDGGGPAHNDLPVEVRFPLPYFAPRPEPLTYVDVDICLGELNVLPLNRPDKKRLLVDNEEDNIFLRENWNEAHWAMLGRDIAGNDHLRDIEIGFLDLIDLALSRSSIGALNDQNMKTFFQGLTRSNSMRSMTFFGRGFGIEGVQAMIPFLKNSNNLIMLDVDKNAIKSEGFSLLWRALHDRPIESLWCGWCGVDKLEIGENCVPKYLKKMNLSGNNIDSDGCRQLTKLFLKKDSILKTIHLEECNIDDEGVAILVDALRKNTCLTHLNVENNQRISMKGKGLMLKLVNDITSIKATLQSNHTLIAFGPSTLRDIRKRKENPDDIMLHRIGAALDINLRTMQKSRPKGQWGYELNSCKESAAAAGRWKVISTQLNSEKRALLCRLQDIDIRNDALYSEINPLHLPEVLEYVDCNHGHSELYVALQSTTAGLFSTINRKKFLQERLKHHMSIIQEHTATAETLRAQIAAIEKAEGNVVETENESRSVGFKRRRTS